MTSEILALQWLEHSVIFNQSIGNLRNKSAFTDATLACEGKFYPVHKFVLSTCSEYFSAIFDWTPCVNPVIVINNIPSQNLESLLDFMYRGETHVNECQIQDVIKAAECLHIKGLSFRQDIPLLKNRPKSPNEEEPRKKKRKPELKKACSPYAKPHLQGGESIYSLQSTSSHPSSFGNKTSVSSNILGLLSSPTSISSAHNASSISSSVLSCSGTTQHNFHSGTNLNSKAVFASLSPARVESHVKVPQTVGRPASVNTVAHQIDTFPLQNQQRTQYIKNEHLVLPSLTNLAVTEGSSISEHQTIHYATRYTDIIHPRTDVHRQSLDEDVPSLPQMDEKIIGIGEEIHLEGPVKELEITTEDGTVSIPEILEGLVNMRQLYDSKAHAEDNEPQDGPYRVGESKQMEVTPHCSTSSSSVTLLEYKEDTNDSMYEFTEDIPEASAIARINMLKDKNLKTYSNCGAHMKRKSVQVDSSPKSVESESDLKEEVKGPFVCTTCDRVCKKKDSLTRHMRTHSEYPYTCTVCSLKCKAYKEFITHRKIHATKRCDKCDFVTIRNDNLRRHMLSHQEEKNHKCPHEECKYSSSRLSLLTSHLQSHHLKKQKQEDEETNK